VSATFDAIIADVDPPMYIVTAAAGEDRGGCLVGFATQASIDPTRFLVCISRANHTHAIAQRAAALCVHAVPADAVALADLFGGETEDETDKLARCEWAPGPGGLPVLAGCPNWFVGRIVQRVDAGDHEGFLLEPTAAEHGAPGQAALRFRRVRGVEPGHAA